MLNLLIDNYLKRLFKFFSNKNIEIMKSEMLLLKWSQEIVRSLKIDVF